MSVRDVSSAEPLHGWTKDTFEHLAKYIRVVSEPEASGLLESTMEKGARRVPVLVTSESRTGQRREVKQNPYKQQTNIIETGANSSTRLQWASAWSRSDQIRPGFGETADVPKPRYGTGERHTLHLHAKATYDTATVVIDWCKMWLGDPLSRDPVFNAP